MIDRQLISSSGQVEPCEGSIVLGRVYQVILGQALLVSTPYGNGRIDITDISDSYTDDPLSRVMAKKGCVK